MQNAENVAVVLAFADVSTKVGPSGPDERNRALNTIGATGRIDVRSVSLNSPLEIVVTLIIGASGGGLAFRAIRLGERVAELRERWALSRTQVARSEMQIAYYRMLEEQITVADGDHEAFVENIRPLTERTVRALLEVESIEPDTDSGSR